MHTGKLYRMNEEQFVVDVDYRLLGETLANFWGELGPAECTRIADGGDYIVKLADNRKIKCNLKKNVNRAAVGFPARFVYRFAGS
ncbi:hypothetical protein ACFLV4_07210 [Chloroflexota bacterium]